MSNTSSSPMTSSIRDIDLPGRIGRSMRNLTKCPICGRRTSLETHDYKNTGPHASAIFRGQSLVKCARCDSMWTPDPPDTESLGNYYASSYSPARMGNIQDDRWPIWDTRAASLITLARLFVPFQPGETFIDVGPGNGASLSLAPLMLPSPQLGCVEFNERSIDFFKRHIDGIRVTQTIEEFAPGSAAIVYSAHSLEHYSPDDALHALESIRQTLRPGGVLTLEVPYSPSERTIVSKHNTPHLIFFSERGIRKLVQRSGLHVRMCTVLMGRTQNPLAHKQLRAPASLSPRFTQTLKALNNADMVAQPPSESGVIRGTLKLVAVKEDTSRFGRSST